MYTAFPIRQSSVLDICFWWRCRRLHRFKSNSSSHTMQTSPCSFLKKSSLSLKHLTHVAAPWEQLRVRYLVYLAVPRWSQAKSLRTELLPPLSIARSRPLGKQQPPRGSKSQVGPAVYGRRLCDGILILDRNSMTLLLPTVVSPETFLLVELFRSHISDILFLYRVVFVDSGYVD